MGVFDYSYSNVKKVDDIGAKIKEFKFKNSPENQKRFNFHDSLARKRNESFSVNKQKRTRIFHVHPIARHTKCFVFFLDSLLEWMLKSQKSLKKISVISMCSQKNLWIIIAVPIKINNLILLTF